MIKRKTNSFLRLTMSVIASTVILLNTHSAYSQPDGAALYQNNCASCHKIDQDLVGPALKGINERRDEAWLIKWIKNSQAVINSGDQYAKDIFAKYNNTQMPAFNLSDDEIKAILAYVKTEEKNISSTPAGSTSVEGQSGPAEEPWVKTNASVLIIVGAVALLLVIYLLYRGKSLEAQYQQSENKSKLNPVFPNFRFTTVRVFYTLLFSLITFAVYSAFWAAENVGIQKGYAPKQPIAYSHELHAGKYQIACSYCHTGVERGKSATIPSVNICMNCHNQIKKESPEIKKIWTAYETGRPIEWIRIHNLQDFVYFNHYQHYKIAGIKCQTCHGEIQTMKVVGQHSKLTMGWCINCHKETKVNLNNGYYQTVQKHKIDEMKSKGHDGLTIAQMGGLECSKCHY